MRSFCVVGAVVAAAGCGGEADSFAGKLDEAEVQEASDSVVGEFGADVLARDVASPGSDDVASLLDGAEPGAVFSVSGVDFEYAELDNISSGVEVAAEYGSVISPVLLESLQGELERYQNQVQFVVNRVHNDGFAKRVHLLGAAYRELPQLDGGVSIVATVLIDNRGSEAIADVVIDAELLSGDRATVADGRFVLDETQYGKVASETMMLANLIFPPARVLDAQADLVDQPLLETRVDWEVAS